ncbi:MAG: hypothetical protein JXA18_14715 [Chitinispirillaceae bacterium]|nr:hypothetical protein [Chitinispirillaceae bacterium]
MYVTIHKAVIIALAASAFTMVGAGALPPETVPPFKPGEVPAFPGAEGAGMWTVGGRGGRVYEVTSLEDSGPGTLREACEAEGARTIVFRTGGVIRLKERITITNPYITIAGQTAPGGGICISNNEFWINTHQVIVRHIRVRVGRAGVETPILYDGLGGRPVSDIIVDHVSCSWAHDENLSFYKMEDADNDGYAPPTERVTVQWSIISETLGHRRHPYGCVFGGRNATYHHNLHACNPNWEPFSSLAENPAPDHLDLINNVFYIWRNRWLKGGGEGPVNIINNRFVPDPQRDEADEQYQIITIGNETGGRRCRYMAGNGVQGYEKESADNWASVKADVQLLKQVRSDEPFVMFAPVSIQSDDEAYEAVLEQSGATLPRRDTVDRRIVNATRRRKTYYLPIDVKHQDWYPFDEEGIMDLPDYTTGTAPSDGDHDGMLDEWETANGLNSKNADDGSQLKDGYTNLEHYLNELADGKPTGAWHQSVDNIKNDRRSNLKGVTVSSSEIRFQLERETRLTLEIFDVRGRRYTVLTDGVMTAGRHELRLELHRLPAGLRLVRITAGPDNKAAVLFPFN